MPAIDMRNITKSFGGLKANDGVSLRVEKGEIHAIVGENGAGKSTLMNILYGIFQPDSGSIIIQDKEVSLETPAKAISLGIGMVHQHFKLVAPLTVTENIVLGREPTTLGLLLDSTRASADVRELSAAYRFNLDPSEKVDHLSVGLQQRVEILKALYRKADILILDEPTAVLTPQETEELFEILRTIKAEGRTILLITHKLAEVMAMSDNVTVMRRGKDVGNLATHSTSKEQLARLMVGPEMDEQMGGMEPPKPHRQANPSPAREDTKNSVPVLRVDKLSALNDRNLPALRDISFSIERKEILGIAAIEGNGQSELVQVLTGLRNWSAGSIVVEGIDCQKVMPAVGHVPEDRHKHGLVLDFSLDENFILGRQKDNEFCSHTFMRQEHIRAFGANMVKKFDIRAAQLTMMARQLSGGNQQKIVLARETSKKSSLMVVSHPTRGLDIYASAFAHRTLHSERESGKAILLVSSDLSELLALSDRIAVMFAGEIVALFDAEKTSDRELGLYMTGARRKAV